MERPNASDDDSTTTDGIVDMEMDADSAPSVHDAPAHVVHDVPVAEVTLGDENTSQGSLSSNSEQLPDEEEEKWSTPMEDEQMKKARTYYIYKRHSDLREAIDNQKPLSGILLRASDGSPQFYVVYKVPGKHFGWYKVSFNDTEGIKLGGLWYAPLEAEEANAPPSSVAEITKLARSSTIAIPLRYACGSGYAHASKYCVLTNWWRERNHMGQYVLPTLSFDLYEESETTATA